MFEGIPQPATVAATAGGPKPGRKKKLLMLLVLPLLAAVLAAGGYFYQRYAQVKRELDYFRTNPEAAVAAETERLVEEVRKKIALPEGEQPTVAKITDLDRFKDNPFFTKALNGDRLIIFTNAKKAYIYRPSDGKVIEVGTLNLQQTGQTSQSPTNLIR